MRLKRSFMKLIATTMAVIMFLTMFGTTSADAGLFSKIKEKFAESPVKSTLTSIAAVGGAILAGPVVAKALGFASGSVASVAGGASTLVASIGSGIASIGSTIVSGLSSAGGFVLGALGTIGVAIGSIFTGVAGFLGGIISSPLFVPALCLVGAGVAGYYVYKHYKRQKSNIDNSNDIPTSTSDSVVASQAQSSTTDIPVAASQSSASASDENSSEVIVAASESISEDASDELKNAHAEYIKAYNKYMSLVTNVGGSENPDEELRSNLLRTDTQTALTEYREAYNKYITLLRKSNSK